MARYSIEDTTLTALGDAVRGKTGIETRQVILADDLWEIELAVSAAKFYQFPEGTRKVVIKIVQGGSFFNHYHKQANGTNQSIYINDEYVINNVTSTREGFYVANYGGSSTSIAKYQITCYADDVKNTLTPMQMAEAIEGLPPSPPESAYTITGNCAYKFQNGGWDWFIEQYGDRVVTKDISGTQYMFNGCKTLASIPFDINLKATTQVNCSSMFSSCAKLTEIPKIIGKVEDMSYIFNNCSYLRELKEESIADIDWSYVDTRTSAYNSNRGDTFSGCYSLRKYPNSFLAHGNPVANYSYSIYSKLFSSCYVLDEVVDLPVIHRNATWTSNAFSETFKNCHRLRKLTFETNEDGSPIKIDGWSKQAIDLTNAGCGNASRMTIYNSGLTTETEITNNAETYEALKNNPDRWTTQFAYALYDKTSAVETINTLPDLSGGAGSNTIKFSSWAGEFTDGGAIVTMTEEEIAVATAKGWTVSFA